jgi:mandelate racemase
MSLAKIAALRVRAARVPLPEPHNTASGTVAESPLVLTDLTLGDGTFGHSLVFTYTPAALKPTADLIANLAPLVIGEPAAPLDLEQ